MLKKETKAIASAVAGFAALGPLGSLSAIVATSVGLLPVWLLVKSIGRLLSVREDPKLRELSEKLRRSNELYGAARRVAKSHKNEIKSLRIEIDELVKSRNLDREKMDRLVARLETLIGQMQTKAT